MDRYWEGGVAALGPLLRWKWHRCLAGAWRGGTYRGGALRGGALHGGTLLFPARSRRIKWRIEAKIALVRGSIILTEFFFFSSSSASVFSSDLSSAFAQKVRALITCLE
jgi:hypothetical protein